MRRQPSSTLAAAHETANGLHRAGVMDRLTLRHFGDAPARFGIVLATPGQFLRSLDP